MTNKARFIGVIIVALLMYLLIPAFWKVYKLNVQKSELEAEIRDLSAKNQVLELKLKLLRDDPVYVEYMARKKFRQAKEGEVVYKLVHADEGSNKQ